MSGRRRAPEIIAGTIASDGTPIRRGLGDFTCTKVGTGIYDVYFPENFRVVLMVQTLGGAVGMTQNFSPGTSGTNPGGIRVGVYNGAGAQADIGFNFIALGIQL